MDLISVFVCHDINRLGHWADFVASGRMGLCGTAGFGAMVEHIAPYGAATLKAKGVVPDMLMQILKKAIGE